ncbi:hypothetical protein AOLI_G00321350 [Acnodon oligacanthus]
MAELRAEARCLLALARGSARWSRSPSLLEGGHSRRATGIHNRKQTGGFRHCAAVKGSIEWRQEGCVKSGGGSSTSKASTVFAQISF